MYIFSCNDTLCVVVSSVLEIIHNPKLVGEVVCGASVVVSVAVGDGIVLTTPPISQYSFPNTFVLIFLHHFPNAVYLN